MTLSALAQAEIPTPLIRLPHAQRVSLALALRGGPRYEPPGDAGLTHAVEHLIFRGAGPYPDATRLLAACEALGEEPAAHTADDALVVQWDVDPDAVGPAVTLLLELLLRPRYAGFAAEVEVIREELLERLDDRGRLTASDDLLRELVFGEHPLGRSILGSEARLRSLHVEEVEAWRARLVRGGNLVLAAAGPLTPEAWSAACAGLSAIPSGPALPEPAAPPDLGGAVRFVEVKGSSQVELAVCLRGPGTDDPRHPALRVLFDLLDGGPSAPLREALVDSGLSYDAQASLTSFPECALLELELAVEQRKLGAAIEALREALRSASARVDAADLARVQRVAARRARWLQDDPTALAEDLALRALRGQPLDPEHALARRAAVTPEEVADLGQGLLQPSRRTALVLGTPCPSQRPSARRALEPPWYPLASPPRPGPQGPRAPPHPRALEP
ncbi:MAG: insulinase family protein, partial [Planctomycetes bacterium]|nr:insulinase family protein [Planctomycetota bacterium]